MLDAPHIAPPAAPSVPFARDLARFGSAPAVVTEAGELTYVQLAERVAVAAEELGTTRRLVLISGGNALEPLVVHLAALASGHPVLLVPDDTSVDALIEAYDPDSTYSQVDGRWQLVHRHAEPVHDLHPDLALLLTTSGSTGSRKLVRLSHENLQANAQSIADYLDIRPTDRAATTLPMHYCYGLSVISSHLLRGAAILLTDLSVVDRCFWERFREQRGTTFAAVPYTFDLLDRVGFADLALPHLRYVTQAGGRLAPDRVRRYAELGRRRGWDLFVMYGQTEATARMAYLPPDLALERPEAIGVAVPGGELTVDADGEIVYRGPNVMLGYAHSPADLRFGRVVDELRTGDLGRRTADGLIEVVGRRSRILKALGLRIDLEQVEATLAVGGVSACCVEDAGVLVAVTTGRLNARRLARAAGLPGHAVRVVAADELPRLPSGKPDLQAVATLARKRPPAPVAPTDLREVYAQVLDRRDVASESTFVSLGGDSLSYVEMSVRLEQSLGHLPPDWHTTPVGLLGPSLQPRRRRMLDMTVALRAVAILLIVGTHADVFDLSGGAHVLLAIAGYNLARFHLTSARRRDRVRRLMTSVMRVVVPSVLWIALAAAVSTEYGLTNVLLLNAVLGPESWSSAWHYWFLEALVSLLLATAALLALPAVDRLERRHGLALPLALIGVGLVLRYASAGDDNAVHTATGVLWLFALGWAAAKATARWQLAALTGLLVVGMLGFFTDPRRGLFVVVGVALMLWVPTVRSSARLNAVASVLAGSSLYVYVTHWLVYPHLEKDAPLLAVAASFAVGIAYWLVVRKASSALRRMTGITAARHGAAAAPLVRVP